MATYLDKKGLSTFWDETKDYVDEKSSGTLKNLYPNKTLNTSKLTDTQIYLQAGTYTLSYDSDGANVGFFLKNKDKTVDVKTLWSAGTFTIDEDIYWIGYYASVQGILSNIQIERGNVKTKYTNYSPLKSINSNSLRGEGNIEIDPLEYQVILNLYDSSNSYKAKTNVSLDMPIESNTSYRFATSDYSWTAVYLYDASGTETRRMGNQYTTKELSFTTTEDEVSIKLNFFPGDGVTVEETNFANVLFYKTDYKVKDLLQGLQDQMNSLLVAHRISLVQKSSSGGYIYLSFTFFCSKRVKYAESDFAILKADIESRGFNSWRNAIPTSGSVSWDQIYGLYVKDNIVNLINQSAVSNGLSDNYSGVTINSENDIKVYDVVEI